jgi:excisionase family DNA binding protein
MVVIPLAQFGLMTVCEVAGFHGVGRNTVWRWISEELLPAVPIDRGYLIRRVDCEALKRPKLGRRYGTDRGGRVKRVEG